MIKKRCVKCGAVSLVKPRQRRCYRTSTYNFLGGSSCWGLLAPLATKKQAPKLSVQDGARINLAHAERMVAEKITAIKRTTTSLSLWTRRVAYYTKRASMTDAEIEAERVKRKTPKPRKRRGVKLEGELHG